MELRHLRYFVAVAEQLHFRKAAEPLHVAQPAVSEQIRKVVALVAGGMSNLEIAERLVVSPATAKTHVSRRSASSMRAIARSS